MMMILTPPPPRCPYQAASLYISPTLVLLGNIVAFLELFFHLIA
jgi:hypothetical protein